MDLEALYRQHYRMVFGYLRGLGCDRALAEELAAETFCRALARIDRFDGRGRLSSWLCQIAKHLYFDERRRQKRHAPLEDQCGDAPSPEEAAVDRMTADELARAAAALPEPGRTVFRMRLTGLSHREIGAALDRSENWARVTCFRAKHRILEQWEGSE